MAGYRGLLTGTHLVLSKMTNREGGSPPKYTPDIFFTLFIAPTDVSVSWRAPHLVKAMFTSIHVDSGNFRLGDLEVSLQQGVKRALYATRSGGVSILSGKERAQELRAFLRYASEAIRTKTHRMEFHEDSRNMHYEVVPQGGQGHRVSNADSSRVGGAISTLTFVIVDDLNLSASVVASIEDAIGSVGRTLASVLGEATYAVAAVEQGLTLAEKAIGTVSQFVADSRILVQRIGAVINAGNRIQAAPINLLKSLNNTLDSLRRDVINPTSNRSTSERMKRLGEEYDRLLRILGETAKDSRRGSFASSNSIQNSNQDGLTTVQLALTDAGDPLSGIVASSLGGVLGGGFQDLPERMQGYTGWLPYIILADDSLPDIASKVFGTPNKWMDIAVVNNLNSSDDLIAGELLQMPVTAGGYDFSVSGFEGLKAAAKALEEAAFFRDIKVDRIGGSNRWVIDTQTLTDFRTVTGPENYVQRFDKVVFQTELGDNPEFPQVGVYLGIGEARIREVVGLTQLTSRQQLLEDPRTLSVKALGRAIDNTGDTVDLRYEVETVSHKVQLSLAVLGGS